MSASWAAWRVSAALRSPTASVPLLLAVIADGGAFANSAGATDWASVLLLFEGDSTGKT
jgi:hypothetical protein